MSSEPSTSELTTKSQSSSSLPTTEPRTTNIGCRETTAGTVPSTTTSTDVSSSTSPTTTEDASTISYKQITTDSTPSTTAAEVTTSKGMVRRINVYDAKYIPHINFCT
jgi:hypothetical protein